ncbi:MAG: purine-nucleoside phosphorylase [Verrucomicrobiota bacterium]
MTGLHPDSAAARLRKLLPSTSRLAIVLGSGFHHVLRETAVTKRIPYAKIPGFASTRVEGHAGECVFGTLGETPVILLSGRVHYYEGRSLEQVTFAIRTLAALGVRDVLLTNAAGGINAKFHPGDFMVITDHINFMGVNPLRGPKLPGLRQFVDLTDTYDAGMRRLLRRAATVSRMKLRAGVYLAVSGPSYETPAEIRAFRRLGADAVGMSTVPEAIAARQCGLRVAGLSCITNLAAGMSRGKISHHEVLETAERVGARAAGLLKNFAKCHGENQ